MIEDKGHTCGRKCFSCHGKNDGHSGGKSSFHMHDTPRIFREMSLVEGEVFLDLGCGPGDYSLYASKIVGSKGIVYALDRSEKCVADLKQKAKDRGLENVRGICGDLQEPLPLERDGVDCVFLATVLHGMNLPLVGNSLFEEIRRVLSPLGRLVIVECKKERVSFGPPEYLRLAPEFLEHYCGIRRFRKQKYVDLGHTYMIELIREEL